MIFGRKTVIAGIRNKDGTRIFIPEKLRLKGIRYVQPYSFSRTVASTAPMYISMKAVCAFRVSILYNRVVVTAPFTSALMKRYIDKVQAAMATNPGASRYLIYDRLASGTISFASPEDRAAPFLRGKGEVVPG
jgi:hypothetical protein